MEEEEEEEDGFQHVRLATSMKDVSSWLIGIHFFMIFNKVPFLVQRLPTKVTLN